MKKILSLIAAFSLASTVQAATSIVKNIAVAHNGTRLDVAMTLDVAEIKVKSTNATLLTPALMNGSDTLRLPAVGLYGRQRWIQYERRGEWITGSTESPLKKWDEAIPYAASVDYQDWMDGAKLVLLRQVYGCSYCQLDIEGMNLAEYFEPVKFPHLMAYVRPEGSGEKARFVEGSAWVQFPVDETIIYADRFNNPVELAKIRASIDSVRNDKDVSINKVMLKGFASPESPYKHNADLASGRVAAVKRYVQDLYKFPDGVVTTDSEPEDWAGLRVRVEASNLEHRQEILNMIDTDMDLDRKEFLIKKTYPEEYRFMLNTWYPTLRHTDYRIEYTIRKYTNAEEAREMAKKNPRNLSLEEFYLAAQGLDQESPEFVELWETAVRMYPDDPTANSNAAATALLLHDTEAAERYLKKATDSPETVFAQGVLATLRHSYDEAEALFDKAKAGGLVDMSNEAKAVLERIRKAGLKE